jgi:hypothetical protein
MSISVASRESTVPVTKHRSWFQAILAEIEFRDWELHLGGESPALWLQVRFDAPDVATGKWCAQHGRKWMLSQHMTKSELVQTAFKAIATALEHEAREDFRYRGQAVFGPHFDVDTLAAIAASGESLDIRS